MSQPPTCCSLDCTRPLPTHSLTHLLGRSLCILVRTGCLTLKEAWSAVNGPVLLSIALSFALGEAINKSKLAEILANKVVSAVSPYGEMALLFAIYAVAITVGAVISNNAVVALMFPVVVRICEGMPCVHAPARASAHWRVCPHTCTLRLHVRLPVHLPCASMHACTHTGAGHAPIVARRMGIWMD